MDAESVMLPPEEKDDEVNPDELVGQFRRFLDEVRPEDFSS